MKRNLNRKPICLLAYTIAMVLLLSALPVGAETGDDGLFHSDREFEWLTVWSKASSGERSYDLHRIPGIVVTQKDTVIIYCEARTSTPGDYPEAGGDWNLMDIYIQRSTDGGLTFGEPIYIARGTEGAATVNNPVMIVGADNTLHMLYCVNYSINGGGLWYRRSTDDGITWSEAVEVTQYAAATADFDCFAFGPNHGICRSSDGMLMVPVWYVPAGAGSEITAHGPSRGAIFYSRDNGETWALSDPILGMSSEIAIAELSDGSIILNARSTPYRKVCVSQDGLTGWSTVVEDEQLPDPGCDGGMVSVNLEGYASALLFVNCASTENREFVTVRCSFDHGLTYEDKTIQLTGNLAGGYADIAVDSKGCVYVLYEIDWGDRVRLARISFADQFGADPAVTNTENTIVFDDMETLSASTSGFQYISPSLEDNALHLVKRDGTAYGRFMVNYAKINKNTDMSEYKYMLCRVRMEEGNGNTTLGVYFRTGRMAENLPSAYVETTVPNDGQWHMVMLDLSELGLTNMLQKMQITLASEAEENRDAFAVDVQGIAFFKTSDEAGDYTFQVDSDLPNDEDDDQNPTDSGEAEDTDPPDTPAPTPTEEITEETAGATAGAPSDSEGCASVIGDDRIAVCVLLVSLVLVCIQPTHLNSVGKIETKKEKKQ